MSIMDRLQELVAKFKPDAEAPDTTIDKGVLIEKIRQTKLFADIPEANLNEMFNNMDTVGFKSGKAVISEGDEGDYYYLLVTGAAKVTRSKGGKEEELATFSAPHGFGEEALISNAKRNATVTMTEAGVVMRLSKDGFNDYVKEPLVTWISPSEAQSKIAEGAKWVDVREESVSKQNHLHGAISVPMTLLRDKFGELEKNTYYICYCENGRLSSTAAFLMRQAGFQVSVLRGGLKSLKRAGIT